ncbi:hypothetical protein [Plantactinospora sp. KLBMP9567]|uniref:hypothetical protein n=1 Tax=Plantactinospora sp. KLBMP9567 TaxID=3085900 RepID=UPI002980AF60|nr:hypothetical protein [Plantactinospora sp. KLBMP9567]MDW5324548.1 hypothetical protein [Plantactinospora sp. KLBMP9567]
MEQEPDEAQITLAREVLERDAVRWQEGAAVMAAAAGAAESLDLTGFHFGRLPNEAGIGVRYAELQGFMTRILREGAAAMADMESALRFIAENYGRADDGAAVRVERTWEAR